MMNFAEPPAGEPPEGAVVRFLLKNLDFLLKNVDFLLKNVDFILKNVDFILKRHKHNHLRFLETWDMRKISEVFMKEARG